MAALNVQAMRDPNGPLSNRENMFTTLQQFRETIVMARKTIKLEKVEY